MKHLVSTIIVVMTLAVGSLVAGGIGHGALLFEYTGQVTNSGAASAQYGNLTGIAGAPSGVYFTFYTTASNTRVTVNGPLRIIDRTGQTTIYMSSSPGDFSSPDSFRSGTPIQVSDLQQQVVVNTATGSFSVVNTNTITSVSSDDSDILGDVGQRFRTLLSGQLNATGAPPPSGWFGGYAWAVK